MATTLKTILDWLNHYSSAIVAIATFFVALFTWRLWRATSKLFRSTEEVAESGRVSAEATKISADAAKISAEALPRVERAYLLVANMNLHQRTPRTYAIEVQFTNYGKTPAHLIGWEASFLMDKEESSSRSLIKKDQHIRKVIAAGDQWPLYVNFDVTKSPREIVGFIEYEDIFHAAHTTRFCYKVLPGRGLILCDDLDQNSYD